VVCRKPDVVRGLITGGWRAWCGNRRCRGGARPSPPSGRPRWSAREAQYNYIIMNNNYNLTYCILYNYQRYNLVRTQLRPRTQLTEGANVGHVMVCTYSYVCPATMGHVTEPRHAFSGSSGNGACRKPIPPCNTLWASLMSRSENVTSLAIVVICI